MSAEVTFDLGKDVGDIAEATLLPKDWYLAKLIEVPKVEANRAMKNGGPGAEGAGENWVLILEVVDKDPRFNERRFWKYLPRPRSGDAEAYSRSGRTWEDEKLAAIAAWAKVFGTVDGSRGSWKPGTQGYIYIVQEKNQRGEYANGLDFNTLPRSKNEGPGTAHYSGIQDTEPDLGGLSL